MESEQMISDKKAQPLAINSIVTLSIDAAQAARSGHPVSKHE
jgi:transketolase